MKRGILRDVAHTTEKEHGDWSTAMKLHSWEGILYVAAGTGIRL